jgi:polysaccharide export outer membrane protein
MKNRSTSLLLSLFSGLLLITVQTTLAQQPSGVDSRDKSADVKCHVTVTGAVHVPTRIEMRRRVRLLEALALVGGTTDRVGKTILITHPAPDSGCEKLAPDSVNEKLQGVEVYDLKDVLRGEDNANPYLQPGDTVEVSEAQSIYVVGSVFKPQAILIREPLTLTRAIAIVGGTLPDARTDSIRVIRHGPGKDARTGIRVSLKEIMRGRAKDLTLEPFDIVDVPSKKGGHPMPPIYDMKPKSNEMLAKELPLRVVY